MPSYVTSLDTEEDALEVVVGKGWPYVRRRSATPVPTRAGDVILMHKHTIHGSPAHRWRGTEPVCA